MKREILAVIVKYLVVDQDRVEIALEQRDRTHSKLVAEIPFAKEKQQIQIGSCSPETATGRHAQTAESNGAGETSPVEAKGDEASSQKTSRATAQVS